jgi:hypothetical protein
VRFTDLGIVRPLPAAERDEPIAGAHSMIFAVNGLENVTDLSLG